MATKEIPEVTITNEWGQTVTVYGEAAAVLQQEIDAGRIDPDADPKHVHVVTDQELPFLTDSDLELAKGANEQSLKKIKADPKVNYKSGEELAAEHAGAQAKPAASKTRAKAAGQKASTVDADAKGVTE